MARVGSDVLQIQVTTVSSTAAFRDITQQVTEIDGFMIEAILEETHTFGDSWTEQSFVGVRRIGDITIRGFYDDDTSTGTFGIFGNATDAGAERVMKLDTGTTNVYPKFDFIVKSYTRQPSIGELTKFELVLAPTGALTVVTT